MAFQTRRTLHRAKDNGLWRKGLSCYHPGKLTGQRHRTEKFKEGYINICGEPETVDIDKGFAVAKLKPGVIGVTVEIMRPTARLPDEIDVTSRRPRQPNCSRRASTAHGSEGRTIAHRRGQNGADGDRGH